MKTKSNEFETFNDTMRKLIAVPHSEIKAKPEAEKAAKAEKKKQADKNNPKAIVPSPGIRCPSPN